MFVDKAQVTLRAGNGGDGAMSFRHEKFISRGGPDGGDGGNGGDIILRASNNQNTLASFRYQKSLQAEHGDPGTKRRKHGKTGKDLEVAVPVGTQVLSKEGEVLADLTTDGQSTVIARGGKGGFGNAHFVSSTRQAPRVAEKGEKGEILEANLELKMIADVGIIGLPNAGKSTFLSVVSNAKPEIANYPFTTIMPNLGVVDIDKQHSLLLADIPGLIEGASQGKGLGDEFLRHVERTSVLLHLIDIYNDDIKAAYKTIMAELAAYKAESRTKSRAAGRGNTPNSEHRDFGAGVDLSSRPQIVALTKIEGVDKEILDDAYKTLKQVVPRGTSTAAISSKTGEGIAALMRILQKQVSKANKQAKAKESKPTLPIIGIKKEDDDIWEIAATKEGYLVTGKKIERFAVRTHFGDYHSEQRLRDIMRKTGIIKELERRGIEQNQKVVIGEPAIGEIEY